MRANQATSSPPRLPKPLLAVSTDRDLLIFTSLARSGKFVFSSETERWLTDQSLYSAELQPTQSLTATAAIAGNAAMEVCTLDADCVIRFIFPNGITIGLVLPDLARPGYRQTREHDYDVLVTPDDAFMPAPGASPEQAIGGDDSGKN